MSEKVKFYTIPIRSLDGMSWVYSATDFQNLLEKELAGQVLKRFFVRLYGYLASEKRNENHFDFLFYNFRK